MWFYPKIINCRDIKLNVVTQPTWALVLVVKLDKLVEEDERVTQIPVKSSIIWKGGKKIITPSGIIDGKTFKFLDENE